jgi:Carboxypeptidase regulatory-like domain/TonB dependent receptor/TonB-dependent Receptor Plug Domain
MRKRRSESVLLGLFLLTFLETAGAQVITGSILGTVRDETGAVVPGALATIRSPALLGGPATFVTNEKGQYRFPSLAPGLYGLSVEISGFRPYIEEGLRVQVGATLEQSITLAIAAVAESLTVTSESPLLDTKESGQSTHYGNEYLQNTPTRRFSTFDLIKSAPGMSPTRPSAGAFEPVSAFGSGANENTYLVDGTDFTGAYGGSVVPWVDPDIIEEIQIVGLGASAEYGSLQGAVFNVVSRQGGNDFQFDASYYGQWQDLTSQPVELPCDCAQGETGYVRSLYRDFTTHLGGPILRDRLWFFGGYQYLRDHDSQPGSDSRFPRESDSNRIFWKINWQITPNFKLMTNYNDSFWTNTGPFTASSPYASGTTDDGHNPSLTFVDLTHIVSPNTLWDARVSGYYWTGKGVPNTDYDTPAHYDLATGVSSGGSFSFFSGTESRTVGHAKVSHYATDFLHADHDFKFGIQLVAARMDTLWGYPGGVIYLDYEGEPYLALLREPYTYGGASRSIGAYAEDTLTLGGQLSLDLGLRFDRSRAISQDLNGLNAVGEETGATVEGLGTLYSWNVLSPRLGFNLKLTSDGRTLLHGNWGRYHQGVLLGEPAAVHPGITPQTEAFYDPATLGYTDIVAVVDPKAQLRIDPETRSPYTDQFSLGFERELFTDVATSATYVHKEGRDFIGWWDVAGVYEPGTETLENGQTLPVFSLVSPTDDRLFLLTNQGQLFLTYNGLLLTFEKRWSERWQALVSYSVSESVGLQATSNSGPGANQSSTTYGSITFGRDPNDYTNATGPLNNDRTHMFRVQGAVEIPRIGILVGANFQYLTGQPWAATANVRLPQGSQRILIEPRGTRRLSPLSLLDLRVSKIFRFGEKGKVEILADILNALNDTAEVFVASDNFFSPNFGEPERFADPLRAMLGVKFSF